MKMMIVLSVFFFVDCGDFDFDCLVCDYWFEFGKFEVIIVYFMSYIVGFFGFDELMVLEDFYDWEKIIGLFVVQELWWEFGMVSGYYVIMQGYLIGEVVCCIIGQSFGIFFCKEIVEFFGIDFYIGLFEEYDDCVGDFVLLQMMFFEQFDLNLIVLCIFVNFFLLVENLSMIVW